VAEPSVVRFAGLLRQLRTEAGLTQEELAAAAGLSARSVSDLERGVTLTARKETARLLANALNLTGPARASFEAIARGRAAGSPSPAADTMVSGIAAAVRTLPRDIASYTGRLSELRQLVGAAEGAADSAGVVAIHAIGGMAGIGKTAFAVHAAHQLAPRFPDGQIFLPLHGHTPGHRPVDPADALASLLQTAGVPAAQIPPALEARMALWRDHLAGRQLLLLLDDAVGSEQVRPLLPGSPGSLVLVTSRRHLTALEDAQLVSLDILQPTEAAELLIRLAARPGLAAGDPAVAEITRLCGYLPLAVGMLARQLHHHPAWTPAELAADMAAARDRPELIQAENLSVAAAFNLSYQDLTPDQQRLFRHLGLHPGTEIDAYAAAALDDTGLAGTRRGLEALYDHYLLTEPTRGRYRFHDLIREHARSLSARDNPDTERGQAVSWLLDYYQHTAAIAEARLTGQTRGGAAPASSVTSRAVAPELPDRTHALSWLRTERANLLACLDHVTLSGQHARVIGLTAAIASLLRLDGTWAEAVTRHATAIQAAQNIGDQPGHANALLDLGSVRHKTGDYPEATEALGTALPIFRTLGDRLGQATVIEHLAGVRLRTSDYLGAARALRDALDIYRDLGEQQGEAYALNELGLLQFHTGEYPAAVEALETGLSIHCGLGDRQGEANALKTLGMVRRRSGNYQGAAEALEQAVAIFRDLGNRSGQLDALSHLGFVWRLTGNYRGAADALQEALSISRDLGDKRGEGNALNFLGSLRRDTGDYLGAAEALEDALGIYRKIGDRGGEAETLNETGTLRRLQGDLNQAEAYHQQALSLSGEMEGHWDEAHALAGLGRCALAAGRTTDAAAYLRQAGQIFQRIGPPEAAVVAAELDTLTETESP